MYTPYTFLTRSNRKGRTCEALHYVCTHGLIMSECEDHYDPVGVERCMVEWWNNSFAQMQDRITVRDAILRGDNVS